MTKIELMVGAPIFLCLIALGILMFFHQFSSCTSDNSFAYCTIFWKLYW